MNLVISDSFRSSRKAICDILQDFDSRGKPLGPGSRNVIKIFEREGQAINVKSFQIPNVINKVAYRFFRKSKARRSYEYAQELLARGIGTPDPMAYAEVYKGIFFTRSFYVSQQLETDLTYRTLVNNRKYPNWEAILRAFTRFTYGLHEKQVQFLDHSPGNTLIQDDQGSYRFYLVDLNRMNFGELSFEDRMKNFCRLTPEKDMVRIMASEYASCIGRDPEEVLERMWFYTSEFQRKFHQKKALKKKIKFWKNK